MKPVLFASTKPFERAENIRAAFIAYDGPKAFVMTNGRRQHPAIKSGQYDIMVIDEYPTESPGKCIMIWHSVYGGKYVGLDQPHPYFAAWQAPLIDYIVTSGDGAIKDVAMGSNVPVSKVLPLGVPRTDAYIGKKKGDGQTVLAGKRSYLYVPTYRAAEEPASPEINWDWLDEQLTDDEILAVKVHTMTRSMNLKNYRHIVEIPSSEPTAQYLYDCDVTVTDYSSTIFDGYLLGKPAVLFEKEKGYVESRGMYLDYPKQYCSRYCMDEKELLRNLREADGLQDTERECVRYVANACDGHSSERVCNLIRQIA